MKERKSKSREQQELARERINQLFKLCEEAVKKNTEEGQALANRYAALAKKISMKYKVKLPKNFKLRICKNCGSFLTPGKNLRVRVQDKKIVYTCLNCGNIIRIPYKKKS